MTSTRRFGTARFVASLIGAALLLSSQSVVAQRPLKVFISVDMEGVAGTVQPAQLGPAGFEYARAREWVTAETNAAIEGAREAGAAEIVVADSHGNAQNILIDQLPDDVRVVRGFPRPLSMMQGIDESFSAAVFIGYHSSEYTVDSVRSHTFSSARLLHVKLHGVEASEGLVNAAIAGHFGVPVAFISGDRQAVEQLQAAVPGVAGAAVKEAFGYHSAMTVTPVRAQAMIREGVAEALRGIEGRPPYRVDTPIELEIGFKLTLDAERAAFIPGLERVDAHAVRGRFPDILQIMGLISVVTNFEAP